MAPMVRMPEVLTGMVEAVVQKWLVSEGDTIQVGTPLAEVETEKALVEIASDAAGVVSKLLIDVGDAVGVGVAILELQGTGDTSAPPADDTWDGAAPPERVFASPNARRLARELSLDLRTIRGTGEGGRVVRRDLESRIPAETRDTHNTVTAAPAADVALADAGTTRRVIALTGMRRAIARRMTESKTTVPHFYLTSQCDVGGLQRLRAELNAVASTRLSVNDFIVKAVARALQAVPRSNLIWSGDHLAAFDSADISVAMATEGGLLAPVVRGADALSVSQLSATIVELAARARAGQLRQEELEGGSFTVSNLGMYGVEEFSAILNPPQSGVLAVGAITDRVVAVDGEAQVRPMMTVTVSWDHRAIDGAVGAEWLRAFVEGIERPLGLLL